MRIHKWQCGAGRFQVEAVAVHTSHSICIYLGGGEKPHIGCVVLAEPRPSLSPHGGQSCTSSVINLLAHKDDIFARKLAESLCIATGLVVSVSAGVHVHDASNDDIENMTSSFYELMSHVLKDLSSMP